MNKSIISGALLLFSLGAAAEYQTMVFSTTSGAEHSIPASGLKINFSEGNMIAVSGNQQITLPVSTLSTMKFTGISSAMNSLSSDTEGVVTVCNIQGLEMGKFNKSSDATASLPAGIYIFKTADGKAVKTMVRK